MAFVSFSGVGKVYDDGTRALGGFDLQIADGEFMVFVGPSGCGKTTALRMVAGLEEITEGEIRIGDRVVNGLEPRDRDVAMVFQNYALYPYLSVYDNMAFGLKMRKVQRGEVARRVNEIARVLRLEEFLQRKPRQLSGGQRQRVAMGRAIVRDPAVFLMDEPLSNLDARLRVQMRAEISRIQRDLNATTIYVTHDQVEAMTMGDRVAVLRKGELQQTADPETLFDRPANLFVASFIGSPEMNLLQAVLERDGGRLALRLGDQRLLLPEATAASRPALGGYEGRRIGLGVRPEHLSMRVGEEVFLSGSVVLTEPLGSERLVHIELAVPPVVTDEVREVAADADAARLEELESEERARRALVLGRFERSFAGRSGDSVEIALDTRFLHFFDLESGAAIYG
jgi:multiple sugar transport system ATP-binding protein